MSMGCFHERLSNDDHRRCRSRPMRVYLEIIRKNHGDVVRVHVTLLLNGELLLRFPAGDGVHVYERIEKNSGSRVQEADAALTVRPTRAQCLELVGSFWNRHAQQAH